MYPPLASNDLVGKRIRALREEMNLTQEIFSQRVGASRTRVANWETGLRRPDLDAAIRICEVTGSTTDYLILGRSFTLPSDLREALAARVADLADNDS